MKGVITEILKGMSEFMCQLGRNFCYDLVGIVLAGQQNIPDIRERLDYSGPPPIHPAHAIYIFTPSAEVWSRPRGSPRMRWRDVIAKYLTQLETTLQEASNVAIYRIAESPLEVQHCFSCLYALVARALVSGVKRILRNENPRSKRTH